MRPEKLARGSKILLVSILLLLLAGSVPVASPWLMYERNELLDGQLWRLITAHFTHMSASHLQWNVAALGALLTWAKLRGELVMALVFISLASPLLSVLLLLIGIDWYAGLSGVLHGLLALLLLQSPAAIKWPGLVLLVTKLIVQAVTGEFPVISSAMPVLHEAHWLGLVIGVGYFIARIGSNKARPIQP